MAITKMVLHPDNLLPVMVMVSTGTRIHTIRVITSGNLMVVLAEEAEMAGIMVGSMRVLIMVLITVDKKLGDGKAKARWAVE